MNVDLNNIVKEELLRFDEGVEVVLFGSRARGNERNDSDWDYLILTEREADKSLKKRIRDKIYELELETGAVIGSVIHSKDKWSQLDQTPLFKNVAKVGLRL